MQPAQFTKKKKTRMKFEGFLDKNDIHQNFNTVKEKLKCKEATSTSSVLSPARNS